MNIRFFDLSVDAGAQAALDWLDPWWAEDDLARFVLPATTFGVALQAGSDAVTNTSTNGAQAVQAEQAVATALSNGTTAMAEDFGASAASVTGSDTLQGILIQAGEQIEIDLQWASPSRPTARER